MANARRILGCQSAGDGGMLQAAVVAAQAAAEAVGDRGSWVMLRPPRPLLVVVLEKLRPLTRAPGLHNYLQRLEQQHRPQPDDHWFQRERHPHWRLMTTPPTSTTDEPLLPSLRCDVIILPAQKGHRNAPLHRY